MLLLLRFVAIAFVSHVVLAQSSAAQSSDQPLEEQLLKSLSELRIDEIVEVTHARGPIVIKVSPAQPDGKIVSDQFIVCDRSNPGRDYLIIQDYALKTEDRWGVAAGFCDALLAAARQAKDAQGRQLSPYSRN